MDIPSFFRIFILLGWGSNLTNLKFKDMTFYLANYDGKSYLKRGKRGVITEVTTGKEFTSLGENPISYGMAMAFETAVKLKI